MRTSHTNVNKGLWSLTILRKFLTRISKICGAVRFIPNRTSEILSAGYDSALLHFDTTQGSVLSRFDIGEDLIESEGLLVHVDPS